MAVDLLNKFVIFLSDYLAIIVVDYSNIQKAIYIYIILHKARLNFNGCIGSIFFVCGPCLHILYLFEMIKAAANFQFVEYAMDPQIKTF